MIFRFITAQLVNNNITMGGYTTYPNGYITVDAAGLYTKHYYIGSQRLASRMGDGTAAIFEGKASDTRSLKADQQTDLQYYATLLGVQNVTHKATPDYNTAKGDDPEAVIYYYHPDHLGSNTFVTDMVGLPYQMFVNLPFGETMAEQTSTGYFQNVYKFNGKELDKETGLYYYGARYYDPRGSLWLSVDPMAHLRSWVSPYSYCQNNPIGRVDPDGALDTWYVDGDNNVIMHTNDGSNDVVRIPDNKVADFKVNAQIYNNGGLTDYYNSQGWNDYNKGEYGLASQQLTSKQVAVLGMLNSDWSRENAVEFWLNPTASNAAAFSFSEAISQWTNPYLVVGGLSAGIAGLESLAATSRAGIVKNAASGKGNFGLGSASYSDAMAAGKQWVGSGYRVASDGKTLISSDGLRQFRPPSYKPKLKKTQANFESRTTGKGAWQTNGHLDIK